MGQKLVVGDVGTARITALRQHANGARAPTKFVFLHFLVACQYFLSWRHAHACAHTMHMHMYVHTCTQNTHTSTGQRIDGKQPSCQKIYIPHRFLFLFENISSLKNEKHFMDAFFGCKSTCL